jgi:GTPase Era involved in 16S rRNA processing
MKNIMKSEQLECELLSLGKEIENFMYETDLYMENIDMKYKNRLRDMEMVNSVKEKEQEIVTIINKINVIELKAVPLNDRELMAKCECKKAKLINLMIHMQSKYGC